MDEDKVETDIIINFVFDKLIISLRIKSKRDVKDEKDEIVIIEKL